MKNINLSILALSSIIIFFLSSCASTTPIQRFSESKSKFKNPTKLMSNDYPANDIYRIYHHAASGFTSIDFLRSSAEQRAQQYAERLSKSFTVLGEQISQPPYILGNFPRIEIVFALVDKKDKILSPKKDKISELSKLKKLLDDGTLTKEEFEKEKIKIIDQN